MNFQKMFLSVVFFLLAGSSVLSAQIVRSQTCGGRPCGGGNGFGTGYYRGRGVFSGAGIGISGGIVGGPGFNQGFGFNRGFGNYYGGYYLPQRPCLKLDLDLIKERTRSKAQLNLVKRGIVFVNGFEAGSVDQFDSWYNFCYPLDTPGEQQVSIQTEDDVWFVTRIFVVQGMRTIKPRFMNQGEINKVLDRQEGDQPKLKTRPQIQED